MMSGVASRFQTAWDPVDELYAQISQPPGQGRRGRVSAARAGQATAASCPTPRSVKVPLLRLPVSHPL